MRNTLIVSLLVLVIPAPIWSLPKQGKQSVPPITLPPAQTQTVSPDVSFQLGQQSGKIDAMTHRLDSIEGDVKEISKDVGRLNVYASIAGLLIAAILVPLVYEGVKRFVFKREQAQQAP